MSRSKKYLAFDIGASNGRLVAAEFNGKTLSLNVVNRFDNGPVRVRDHLYWNILGLWEQCRLSLHRAASQGSGEIVALGVDTWGNDFALLDAAGDLVCNPYCYRDPQTTGMMDEAFKIVPREDLFQITGIQFMIINCLYHLVAMVRRKSPALEMARTFVMIPDLLNYWMTGVKTVEYTNASTCQCMDVRTRQWAYPMLSRLGIPEAIFPEIIAPGQVLGNLHRNLCSETGLPSLPVVAVATHDTAAAVASVPATSPDFAYLSSGTWGLLGTELPEAVLSEKVQKYSFGNEGGVFNTYRLLRNISNMWLVQECRRIWAQEGNSLDWETLIHLAEASPAFLAFVDPDDVEFLRPEHMPHTIQAYCRRTGQAVPETPGEFVRVCLESLAFKYRYTFEKLTDILGRAPAIFHIVGGAARNQMLNRFAANALARPVVAGPSEATALGNLIMQMIAMGDLADLEDGRRLIRASFPTEEYLPEDTPAWEEAYDRYLEKTGLPPIF